MAMWYLNPPVQLGETVGDVYELDEVVGFGGIGVVVRATHGPLKLPVAIKFLRRDSSQDASQVQRFVREAELLARLATDHVPQVVELGRLPGGEPFLVMELLEGEDLGDRLSKGPLDAQESVDIMAQVCTGLVEAHRQGIVHRDIKPENLFLTRESGHLVVKVLDFGCSKQADRADSSRGGGRSVLTEPGIGLGTAAYMAPEQHSNARDADARADIWSLGVILYELLADRHPYSADCVGQLMLKIGRGAATPLAELRPDLPAELTDLVHRCMSLDPDDRPNRVETLLATLKTVVLPPTDEEKPPESIASRARAQLVRSSMAITRAASASWRSHAVLAAVSTLVGFSG